MQYLKDFCLEVFTVSNLISAAQTESLFFTWDLIDQHSGIFKTEYTEEDARVALQLSLMVSGSFFAGKELRVPVYLEGTVISAEVCSSPAIEPSPILCVFYHRKKNLVYLVMAGTTNFCEAELDLFYEQKEAKCLTNYLPGLKCYGGVYHLYKKIRSDLLTILERYLPNRPQLVITGHSLGGALAQLAALDLAQAQPIIYSFAAPALFNPLGAEKFEQLVKTSFRVVNLSDVAPMYPLPVMPNQDIFCQVGQLVYFNMNFGDFSANHFLAYVRKYNLHSVNQ